MIGALDPRSDRVASARSSLSDACTNLDDAVRSLSEADADETVMANPALVALLLRVVAARRYLEEIERRPTLGPPSSLR
jgi:hypothetical protein